MAILDYFVNGNTNDADVHTYIINNDDSLVLSNSQTVNWVIPQSNKIHFSFMNQGSNNSQVNGRYVFNAKDAEGTILFAIKSVSSGTLNFIEYMNATATETVQSIPSMAYEYQRYDIEFESNATTGVIRLYVDGVLYYEREGDTQYAGADVTVNDLTFYATTEGVRNTYYKGMFVCDGDTNSRFIDMAVVPVSEGGKYQQMTGSYLDVDNMTIDDSTFVYGGAGEKSSFGVDAFPSSLVGQDVIAVGMHCRAKTDSAQLTSVKPFICDSETDNEIVGNSSLTNGSDFVSVREIFHSAPDGGSWTEAKFESLEVGAINV